MLDMERTSKLLDMVRSGDITGASKLHFEWVKTGKISLKQSRDFMNEFESIVRRKEHHDAWVEGYNDAERDQAENE